MKLKVVTNCIIGVNAQERVNQQPVIVEASLMFDQDLKQEPKFFTNAIEQCIINNKPLLLERMAYLLVDMLINIIPNMISVDLMIRKPQAILCAQDAYVRLCATKET